MSQVFIHYNLIKKTNYFLNCFFLSIKNGGDRPEKSKNARLWNFQVFPHHFWLRKRYLRERLVFLIKIWWMKPSDMHKRVFQGLKHTFMHVSGLHPPYFDLRKPIIFQIVFFSNKNGWGRPEKCKNARLCFFQVFPHHFWLKKNLESNCFFLIKIFRMKTWDLHKRVFQGLKCTFMHVSGLSPPYFDKKPIYKLFSFFSQNMVVKDQRHA